MSKYKCRFNKIFEGVDLKPFFVEKDPFTYCSIFIRDGERPRIGIGFSKRNAKDAPNQLVGRTVAYGRALKDLVQDMGGETRAMVAAALMREKAAKELPHVENAQKEAA